MHPVDDDTAPWRVLLGTWQADDGKTAHIEPAHPDEDRGRDGSYALRVTVRPAPDAPPYPASHTPQAGLATERLAAAWLPWNSRAWRPGHDAIEVEADQRGQGRTWLLVAAAVDADGGTRPRTPDDPRAALVLLPETGAGFLDAVSWQEDEGEIAWAEPLRPLWPV